MSKAETSRRESLERLLNQWEQAKINGDTALAKKIKAVIDRVNKDGQPIANKIKRV